MTRILLNADAPDLTLETVDEISAEPMETVAARYHAVIPADHPGPLPVLADGLRVAFLTTDLAGFERLRRLALPGDLLFRPSAVARLDLLRAGRRTLVTTRAIRAGERLTTADVAETVGGDGVGAAMLDQMIGRTALYDMAEGAAVDFGHLSEDVGGAERTGEVL
ncbi:MULTISPECIES: SAF domain-containing protein [Thalassobaculum]|uniref:SAF domain-containing protein n=1 Tax=Thalassobaculum litoreum DSM 18839 TaxID=1123362 RepID=A0A8G2EW20_9PROT|nr:MULTISPECIES: SAF domain-containing protein [Thalassobaculum]SDF57267.1 hypothetical protein SAMN05660686_01713 [Thalassobaculum litoreum DSM 18839]